MTFVKILYGPYEAYGVIKHRFQKLRGLYECLTALGYEIELVEVNLLNRLTIEMCDRIIYVCNIKHNMFNVDCEDDTVCEKAVFAVQEAKARTSSDKNIPKFTPISKGRRHMSELRTLDTSDILSRAKLWFELVRK